MSEAARPGWKDWYHVTSGSYAKWLPGDPRGWRERNHHEHVAGDYKHLPPNTAFARGRHRHARELVDGKPRVFFPSERSHIGKLLLASLSHQGVPVLAIAVAATNVHALVQCADRKPKAAVGHAKEHVTFQHAKRLPDGKRQREHLWEKGSCAKPIRNRAHALRVFRYILAHKKQGVWTWCFRDGKVDP